MEAIQTSRFEEYTFEEEVIIKKSNGFYNRCVKRTIDFVLALICVIVASPLLLIISLAVIIETGFPVF